jgi:hypothetical protein
MDPPTRTSSAGRQRAAALGPGGAFLQAAGIVLLCHVIPVATVTALWLYLGFGDHQPSCTECGPFAGIIMIGATVVVFGSILADLLIALILVAARMRRPLQIGIIAGVTGILLSLGSVAHLIDEWLIGQ